MTDKQFNHLPEFTLLSGTAQRRLQGRITDARGDIEAVRREIRSQIEQLDHEVEGQPDHVRRGTQADRAFCVAQLVYLDAVQEAAAEQKQPRRQGFTDRLRLIFGRRQPT